MGRGSWSTEGPWKPRSNLQGPMGTGKWGCAVGAMSVWRLVDKLTMWVTTTAGAMGPRGGVDVNVSSGRMEDGKRTHGGTGWASRALKGLG